MSDTISLADYERMPADVDSGSCNGCAAQTDAALCSALPDCTDPKGYFIYVKKPEPTKESA